MTLGFWKAYVNVLCININKCLGTEDTWSRVGGILSNSCLMYNSCSTARGLRCCTLCCIMHHTLSMEDRSGLRAGHYSTRTLLLRRHAVVTHAECGFALSCWNKQRRPWKRRQHMAGKIAKERLESSLEKMNKIYDRQDVECQFSLGDCVLALLAFATSPSRWNTVVPF